MNSKDIISIITTCYNAENYIEYCIRSIIQQITDNKISIEYVLVNDASTDNTLNIINSIINEYKTNNKNNDIEFKVFSLDKNIGCGAARKYGLSKSTGNYIMFLDADDYYIHSDFVLRAYNDITNTGADIVDYGIKYNNNNGHTYDSVAPSQIVLEDVEQILVSMFKHNIIKFNVWSKIYTRNIVNSYPYSDCRTFEDIRTIPIWCSNAKKIVIMPSVEINYRSNPSSIIREDGISTRIGTCTAIYEMMLRFKNNIEILKACYTRAMIDFDNVLVNHTSEDYGFNELSAINTKMLALIYPYTYTEFTYNIDENNQ